MTRLESPLIIEVGEDAEPSDLDSFANRLDPEVTATHTDIVFRVRHQLVTKLDAAEATTARADLWRRFRGRPSYALSLDPQSHAPTLLRILEAGLERSELPEEREALAELRQHDLYELIRTSRRNCQYESRPDLHYEAPSKVHCKSFVRVGDAILDKQSLERMTFWLRGRLFGAHAVLADTWTIALPVMESLHVTGTLATFDALPCHPNHDRRAAHATIERLLLAAPPDARIVCVVSVTSSGSYAHTVRKLFAEQGRAEVEVIGLYRLRADHGAIESLCELDLEPGNYLPHDCPMCQQKIPLLSLDPGLYYAKHFTEQEVPLHQKFLGPGPLERDALAPASETFVRRYIGTPNLFRVHRDDARGRHHAFFVDAEVLQGTAQFEDRLRERVGGLGARDLVLSWDDPSNQRLAGRVAKLLEVSHEVVRSAAEIRVPSERARTAKRVVFVQAVVANAVRLDLVNRAFRERQGGEPLSDVDFFIGLARPPSELHWRRWRNMLTLKMTERRSQLVAVEWCPLPDWKVPECPWCSEYEFLSSVSRTMGAPPRWILERLTKLANRERGLVDPLWTVPGVALPSLAPESPMAPAGSLPIEVLFCAAAALQRLRHADDARDRLDPRPPVSRVFAPRNLSSNYTEALLNAVLMRIVTCPEWGSVSQHELTAELTTLASNEREIILGELLLGVSRRSFGRAAFDAIRPQYEKYLAEHYQTFAEVLFG